MSIQVIVGSEQHVVYAQAICDMINDASQKRGTGIAKRSPEYIAMKLADGKALTDRKTMPSSSSVVAP